MLTWYAEILSSNRRVNLIYEYNDYKVHAIILLSRHCRVQQLCYKEKHRGAAYQEENRFILHDPSEESI